MTAFTNVRTAIKNRTGLTKSSDLWAIWRLMKANASGRISKMSTDEFEILVDCAHTDFNYGRRARV